MNNGNRPTNCVVYIKTGNKKLKWYKKLWNIITKHKERNYEWSLLKGENNE